MSTPSTESYADLFSARGLRCTRQRRALYDALLATKVHPTADMLYRQVLSHCPGMSLATVYNTLEAFAKAGLVLKIPGPDGSARYDGTVADHPHLRVTQTGEVIDLPEDLSQALREAMTPELLERVQFRMGFKISQVHIELQGDFVNPRG